MSQITEQVSDEQKKQLKDAVLAARKAQVDVNKRLKDAESAYKKVAGSTKPDSKSENAKGAIRAVMRGDKNEKTLTTKKIGNAVNVLLNDKEVNQSHADNVIAYVTTFRKSLQPAPKKEIKKPNP